MNISTIELKVYLKIVKGTKLYVAFQNISINIWYTSYFAFDITFSSFMDQKCELNKPYIKM